jgi:hypothetical protein
MGLLPVKPAEMLLSYTGADRNEELACEEQREDSAVQASSWPPVRAESAPAIRGVSVTHRLPR